MNLLAMSIKMIATLARIRAWRTVGEFLSATMLIQCIIKVLLVVTSEALFVAERAANFFLVNVCHQGAEDALELELFVAIIIRANCDCLRRFRRCSLFSL